MRLKTVAREKDESKPNGATILAIQQVAELDSLEKKKQVRRTRGKTSPRAVPIAPRSTAAIIGPHSHSACDDVNSCTAHTEPAHRRGAASDDASGAPAATAATHLAAGTVRNAYAEVAHEKNMPRVPSEKKPKPSGKEGDVESFPPGEMPLPDDPAAFVDEVHLRADLIEVAKALLNSKDEKIRQRALERLLEMKYSTGAAADQTPQIIFDMPRPLRD